MAELRDWAVANDVPVLGTIGDEAHLTANFPEDHTPFSAAAWPVRLPGYFVTAIDLGDVRGLGEAILDNARAGKLPWLKYMNFGGRSYAFADGFVRAARNQDQHVHLSVFSNDLGTDIGDFNPWETQVGTDDLLAHQLGDQAKPGGREDPTVGTVLRRAAYVYHVTLSTHQRLVELEARLDAIAGALDGLVPGVAEACARAAEQVTAEDVAGRLELRVTEPAG